MILDEFIVEFINIWEKFGFYRDKVAKNLKIFIVCFIQILNLEAKMKIEDVINAEIERLSKKFNKDYLDIKDVMQITGLGRDKVREIFNSQNFPSSNYGHKQTVSIMAFVIWQIHNNTKGDIFKNYEERN